MVPLYSNKLSLVVLFKFNLNKVYFKRYLYFYYKQFIVLKKFINYFCLLYGT